MAFTVPAPVRRVLYNTSKRVVDELGKGQEILRHEGVNLRVAQNTTGRKTVLVPDVDIILVGVRTIGDGFDTTDTYELIAPANGEDFNQAPSAANRLIAAQSAPTDDVLNSPALVGLNDNRVRAGQPIIAWADEDDNSADVYLYMQISYILADEERTY